LSFIIFEYPYSNSFLKSVDYPGLGITFNTKDSDWYDYKLADGTIAQYPKWFKPIEDKEHNFLVYHEDGTQIPKMPVGATFFDQTYYLYVGGYPKEYTTLDSEMNKVQWKRMAHTPWDHVEDKFFGSN